jgi:DNA-binding GntR family transcriptional regulator
MDVRGKGDGLSQLQLDLADRMMALFHTNEFNPGDRLTELGLAQRLKVSRTPVRAALIHLESLGVVARAPGRGFTLLRRPPPQKAQEPEQAADLEDQLLIAIARDRLAGKLAEQVSEADLMRRYTCSRQVVLRALTSLAEVGVVSRKPGYGWAFEEQIDDRAAEEESCRFRLLIEPAALLEPTFKLDPLWATEMRRRHEQLLSEPWNDGLSMQFFSMNSDFHEGLARASGNRFIHLAFSHQNRLREFRNYNWRLGVDRVISNCRQHMEILDRLEMGDQQVASLLLRRHLEQTLFAKN